MILLAVPGAAAHGAPPPPAGDWHGVMKAGGGQIRSAIHIEQTGPGVFVGDIDLPDSGLWNSPLEQVTFRDGVLAFSYRGETRRFEGRWDPAAAAWVGRVHTAGGATDIAFEAGFLGLPVIDGLDGYWEGVLTDQGVRAHIILRVATNEHGTFGLLDLPHALETGIPVNPLVRQADTVAFAVPALGFRFEGTLDPDARSIRGAHGAPGSDVSMEFVRNDRGPPARTQTPRAPYPYTSEEVSIANPAGDARLGCTLTVPEGQAPHPVAYLLTGSGQQDRDETLVGHKPFLVLADHLSRHGLAVLRCDDRGAGRSTGRFDAATLGDFAGDVEAGLDFLRARPEVQAGKIGLIGHSEGGIVASMVAARRSDVAFVVLIAGPGVPVHDLLLRQGEETARAQGVPAAVVAQQSAMRRAVYDTALAAETPDAARAAVEALLVSNGLPREAARRMAAQMIRPDILRILRTDPATPLGQVSVPVLAIVGSKDTQVPPAQNLPALRLALARNPDATITELPGLNHLLQTAETGAPAEYYQIEETLAPLALDAITTWLLERGFGRASPRVTP